MTAIVTTASTVAEETERAWTAYEGLLALADNPTFCRIVNELSDPMRQRDRKVLRGHPRNAFAV